MEKSTKEMQKQVAQTPVETERTKNRKVYVPKVDIYETKDTLVILADVPGVDEKSVDVTLEKNILTINGAVEAPQFEGYSLAYTEYDTGDYQRAFTISDEVDRNRIEAIVKNGVLKIVLHKAETAKARKIAIKTEE
jgi:HSP20 family molecular chaperone IbpA